MQYHNQTGKKCNTIIKPEFFSPNQEQNDPDRPTCNGVSVRNAFLRRGRGSISFSWAASLLSMGRLSLTIMISSRQGVYIYIKQGCRFRSALFWDTGSGSALFWKTRSGSALFWDTGSGSALFWETGSGSALFWETGSGSTF